MDATRFDLARLTRRSAPVALAAALALPGCAAKSAPQVACDATCDSPVTALVTSAWEADRAGDGAAALAKYRDVLAADPNNAWAAKRVAALSPRIPAAGTAAMVAESQPPAPPAAKTPAGSKTPAAAKPSLDNDFDWAAEPAVVAKAEARPTGNPFADDAPASAAASLVTSANPFEDADLVASLFEAVPDAAPKPEPTRAEPPKPNAPPAGRVSNVSFAAKPTPDFAESVVAEPPVLALVSDLASPLPVARRAALRKLADGGPEMRDAVPAVSLMFRDESPVVRAEAAWAAYRLTGQAEAAVPTLAALLVCGDAEATSMAVQSLGLIGPPAAPAVGGLRELAVSSPGLASIRAIEALLRIDPADPAAARMLVDAVRFGREAERAEAVYALGSVPRSMAAGVVPMLVNAMDDEAEAVRTAAALTLGGFGEDAEPARRALEAAARFDTQSVRSAAKSTLACLPR